ncbi:MAG: hypothetical protein AAF614_36700 [Chloroflexota bacterium]
MDSIRHEKRQTYLLRFWFEPEQGCWRAHLQEAATQYEHTFANFPELVAFLAQRLGDQPSSTTS